MSAPPPFTLHRPARQRAALVLTSPHSGRLYSAAFLAGSRLDAQAIRRSEDCFVDELFAAAPALGVPLLAATFPRAYCDANREAWELDPAMFSDPLPPYANTSSPRVAAGLGTIARIVGTSEPIYGRRLSFAEARARIEQCWQPFHAALQALISETVTEFGHCLVLDCHSMPSAPGRAGPRAELVLGDGHGESCAPAWSRFVAAEFTALGLKVRRNDPYAGGYITRHYGRPAAGVQVMQIELARGLYMHERQFLKHAGFEDLRARLTRFLETMRDAVRQFGAPGPEARAAAE
ncbi:N-formylglutamate amidohydrolase [Acidocella sp.]|uniref:N-formylglutamate amidohydrolase n=1 Tax=Acidocella sp. TaxID=50710 RepID=UPI00263374A0|nr:N-formylglutamate amidohydrolase [Acidocella sp.]